MQPQNGFHFTTYIYDLEQTKDVTLNHGKKMGGGPHAGPGWGQTTIEMSWYVLNYNQLIHLDLHYNYNHALYIGNMQKSW